MQPIPDYHPSECEQCKAGDSTQQIDWSWIDHVYCISLKDREDRRKEAEREFHKAGLCNKVVFYRPTKDTSDFKRPGTRGCWNSHHTVAKKGYDAGAKMVLIFEDDVEFDERATTPESVRKLADIAKKIKNWNIIYLGSWPFVSLPTRFLNIHRDYSLAAHAYLISNMALEWLATTEYEDGIWLHKNKNFVGFGLDVFYMLTSRTYSFFPMMAFQRGAKSSNQRPNILGKYIFNFALSDARYMKFNQYLVFTFSSLLLFLILLQIINLS